MATKQLIDLEALQKSGRQTGPQSEETQEQIRQQADAELAEEEAARAKENDAEKPPEGEPKKKEGEEQEPKPASEPTPEEKQKKEAEEKAAKEAKEKEDQDKAAADQKAKDEAILSKKEEELTPEDRTRKTELLKVQADAETKEIELLAAAEMVSIEDAKKIFESEKKVVEKYQGEPKKLARAYLSSQREYSRLQARVKADQEREAQTIRENEVVVNGKKMTFDQAKPQIVEAYRKAYSEKCESLDDDQVLVEAKKDYQAKIKELTEAEKVRMGEEAKSRRAKMILDLPESAKPYRAEIEAMITNAPDAQILSEDYDLEDVILWARGRHFTPEKIKEVEDAAFKRGQENAKILGEKKPGPQGGGGGTPPKKGNEDVPALTEKQKQRALEMFSGITVWDDNRKFKEYVEHKKSVGEWPEKED